MSFSTFGLDPRLLKAVERLGFEHPTPIQNLAIPPLMEGRDVLAAAATGSGKTAAFLLPILHRLLDKPRGVTRVLVMAPTRELAAQIADHFRELSGTTPLKAMAVYGGVGMLPQEQAFRRGVDVIVATPGRLLDHMQYSYAKLQGIEVLVLDEADRMLDMGFLPDIRRILKQLPTNRQTMLFSATMPLPIVELSRDMLKTPAALNIERKAVPAQGITHVAYPVPHELKSKLLLELLKNAETKSILAFTRTKHRANRLADFLEKRGVSVTRIHGSRSQAQRTEALAGFKRGKFRVMVATDIAARGIDVEELGLVVNFDVPGLPEDYIHRVGRTARAEATGDAYTFVSPDEEHDLRGIERHLGKPLPRQKVQGFDYTAKPEERFEVPLADRIAAIRARKAEERTRAKANAERRAGRPEGRVSTPRTSFGKEGQHPAGHGATPLAAKSHAARPHSDRPHSDRPRSDRPRASSTHAGHAAGSTGRPRPLDRHPAAPSNAKPVDDNWGNRAPRNASAPAHRDDDLGNRASKSPSPSVPHYDDNVGNRGSRTDSPRPHHAERDKAAAPRPRHEGDNRGNVSPTRFGSYHGAEGKEGSGGFPPKRKPHGPTAARTEAPPAKAHYPRPGNHPSAKDKGKK